MELQKEGGIFFEINFFYLRLKYWEETFVGLHNFQEAFQTEKDKLHTIAEGREQGLLSLKGVAKKVFRKKVIFTFLAIVVVAVAVMVFLNLGKTSAEPPVSTAPVVRTNLENNVFASGKVRLVEKQEFYSYVETTVKEINVDPGDKVKKGQILGLLDAGDDERRYNDSVANYTVQQANLENALNPRPEEIERAEADLRKAETDYQQAKEDHARTQQLYENDAISQQEYDKSKAELVAAETSYTNAEAALQILKTGPTGAELTALKAQIEQSRIQMELAQRDRDRNILTAEMDGTVIAVEVFEGDHIDPGTRLITIGNTDKVEITAGVSEADSGQLAKGQNVTITAAALPGQEYEGVVKSVSPGTVVSSGERGSQIDVPIIVSTVGNAEGLRSGYTVDLAIQVLNKENVLAVPYEAVLEQDGKAVVYVVEKGIAKKKEITKGADVDLYTEVVAGLSEGDVVIVNPNPAMENKPVTVMGGGAAAEGVAP